MNVSELRAALDKMDEPTFRQFIRDFGGDEFRTRENVVRSFVDHPDLERYLCHLLGARTEDEKLLKATTDAASSAELSARTATISAVIAFVSLVVAVLAMILLRLHG